MHEFSSIGSILEGLMAGEMIIVVDDPNRENEGDLVMLADRVTPEAINFMATYGKGLICMPMANHLIHKLRLEPMVVNNTDAYGTAFTVSIDFDNGSTGISAYDRAETILKAVQTEALPEWFKRPGHIFPLAAKSGGVLERRGHTEASVDLAKLCGTTPAAVICEILNEDGTMARMPELEIFAKKHGLKMMTIEALASYLDGKDLAVAEVKAKLPTDYGDFDAYGFYDAKSKKEHIVLTMGIDKNDELKNSPVLVRIHSECLTGDVFSSRRCDCGQQLELSLKAIASEGKGALVYLRQEGRGIGLINKLKCYSLQEKGHDTVSANIALGFAADQRQYGMAAAMLEALGIYNVRLMTGNPEKVDELQRAGLSVSQLQMKGIKVYPENESYLRTKAEKLGHDINFSE